MMDHGGGDGGNKDSLAPTGMKMNCPGFTMPSYGDKNRASAAIYQHKGRDACDGDEFFIFCILGNLS